MIVKLSKSNELNAISILSEKAAAIRSYRASLLLIAVVTIILCLLDAGSAAARKQLENDADFYISMDGDDLNPGSKDQPWADPAYALTWITNNLDFRGHGVEIVVLDRPGGWIPPVAGYKCAGEHVGAGTLTLRGQNPKVTIDASKNDGPAFVVVEGCALTIKDLVIKSGSSGNSLAAFDQSRVKYSGVTWAGAINADILVSRNSIVTQVGPDRISASAANHIMSTHGGQFRNKDQSTTFISDVAYGLSVKAFAFAEGLGEIVYTGHPAFDLEGHKVTGRKCYAEDLGLVQAASLGADFFPGDQPCLAVSGGRIQQ